MIKVMNAKIFENMKDGLKTGTGALERARRVEFRRPWTYRQPLGGSLRARPWLLGTLAVSVLAAVAGILYYRKRRQVTDRYSESDCDPEDVEALNAGRLNDHQSRDERLASALP